ncbi:hypothetical protein PGQ11_014586 [Apiospora arundinis]|uniref:Uncharacterized protein n=1 Tax=Apiospora arundinis TaxID=335852 RepID=A0ABR2HSV0_9PEZI
MIQFAHNEALLQAPPVRQGIAAIAPLFPNLTPVKWYHGDSLTANGQIYAGNNAPSAIHTTY